MQAAHFILWHTGDGSKVVLVAAGAIQGFFDGHPFVRAELISEAQWEHACCGVAVSSSLGLVKAGVMKT